jgi:1,6-anhydro-N-acetylmuramate kinase
MYDGQPRQVSGPVFGDEAAMAVVGGRLAAQQTGRTVAGQDVTANGFGGPLHQQRKKARFVDRPVRVIAISGQDVESGGQLGMVLVSDTEPLTQ